MAKDTTNKCVYPSEEQVAQWWTEAHDERHGSRWDMPAYIARKACDWQAHQCREQIARWMLDRGFATGHGDTIEDLLSELVGDVRARDALGSSIRTPVGGNNG